MAKKTMAVNRPKFFTKWIEDSPINDIEVLTNFVMKVNSKSVLGYDSFRLGITSIVGVPKEGKLQLKIIFMEVPVYPEEWLPLQLANFNDLGAFSNKELFE